MQSLICTIVILYERDNTELQLQYTLTRTKPRKLYIVHSNHSLHQVMPVFRKTKISAEIKVQVLHYLNQQEYPFHIIIIYKYVICPILGLLKERVVIACSQVYIQESDGAISLENEVAVLYSRVFHEISNLNASY